MKIREVREEKGMTLKELARKSGLPYCNIWRWERREGRQIFLTDAYHLAKGLGCSMEDLLTDEEKQRKAV